MLRKKRGIAVVLFLVIGTTACFGSFALTQKLYDWNASHEDEWVQQGAFLITGVFLPVYGLAVLADAVLFNSFEFWTGQNPVQTAGLDEGRKIGEATVDGESVTVQLKVDGEEEPYLSVIHRIGGEVQQRFEVVREGDETRVADQGGALILSAVHRPDGGLAVRWAAGGDPLLVEAGRVREFVAGLATGEAVPSEFAAQLIPDGWSGVTTAP